MSVLTKIRVPGGIAGILTLTIAISIALLMTATTVLEIRRSRSIFYRELEQRGQIFSDTFDNVLLGPLFSDDMIQLTGLAKVVQGCDNVAFVEVYNRDGSLLMRRSPSGYPLDSIDSVFGARLC